MTLRFLAFAFVAMSCLSIQAQQTAFFSKTSSDTVTAIPDGTSSRTSTISIASGEFVAGHLIQSIDFRLNNVQHGWVGDLIFSVQHSLSGQTATLFNRVQRNSTTGGQGDSSDLSGSYSFRDGSPSFWTEAAKGGDAYVMAAHDGAVPLVNGYYAASGQDEAAVLLNNMFAGRSPEGTWTFTMSDLNAGNAGTYNNVTVNMITAIPEPGAIAGWGLLGMFGTLYARRRLKAKQKQTAEKTV